MDIRIRVDSGQPFTGYAGMEGERGTMFVGWLGLLRVLADAVGSGAAESNRLGQFPTGGDPELREHVCDVGLDGPP